MSEEMLIGVFKNHAGEVISFQTSNGRIISYRKALQEIDEGIIEGIEIHGTQMNRDGYDFNFNQFDHLPEIH